MKLTLRALRHRNFALFLSGQISALIGYWIQQIALAWLVYRLTGSATLLGVLALASNLPVLLLAPLAGLWSDRFNRHRMMIATQVVEMLQAITLAALAFSGAIAVWHILALSALLGVCIAVEVPVRHAYMRELIDDQSDLPNAIALNSLIGNSGRLAGPVMAGLLIGWFSEATCFLINALTYVAVLVSFAFIRVRPRAHAGAHLPALRGIRDGVAYAWRSAPIRFLLTLMMIISLTAASYGTLMPAVVHEAFAGNAETLGFLVGAAGLGAVAGTLLLASRHSIHGLERFLGAAAFVSGAALIVFAWSRLLALSLLLMVTVGFSILVISVAVNMILQTIVEEDKRGRVMSLYTMASLGIAPLGGLMAGMLADRMGAINTVLASGVACVLAVLYMSSRMPHMRSQLRETYARLGITK
jgi:MFS family permease